MTFASIEDIRTIESEAPWHERDVPQTLRAFLDNVADAHGPRPATSFQLLSGPKDKAETLTWTQLRERTHQAANLFRSLGVGETDVVAYLLPNCTETVVTLLGGAIAGIVNPINPLLEAEQIAAILRETNAKALVTLRAFPKTDVAQKAAKAVELAPNVKTVLEVDLNRYLTPPKSWIVPLVRPKVEVAHKARVASLNAELDKQPKKLSFADSAEDRVAAYFHTGGTTGMPKVAQHRYSGMIYNGWVAKRLLFTEQDTIMCPLPLFHVFACHPILMGALASGAQVVFPTPAGYRGEGVMDNFWKLCERWKISFIITVPTAISALMQRPVDADVSSVKTAFSGSAPLPVELFRRFEKATDVTLIEGYGLTEATCVVSVNPVDGEKKIGSVGLPFPYTDIRIFAEGEDGSVRECEPDEVGEICVANPGVVVDATYTDPEKNRTLYHKGTHLRTGDLGRKDPDGYVWITGRAKDLIIRGGHNIDPAVIEEALAGHEAVAMAGAIGQPDSHSGELPCVYVELVEGASVAEADLLDYATGKIHERAAHPKYLEILDELPKTAVGKVFKPDLRRRAVTRVYNDALSSESLSASVKEVSEDKKRGLVAKVRRDGDVDEEKVGEVLGRYPGHWEWTAD